MTRWEQNWSEPTVGFVEVKNSEFQQLKEQNRQLIELLETFVDISPNNDNYMIGNGMSAGEFRRKFYKIIDDTLTEREQNK